MMKQLVMDNLNVYDKSPGMLSKTQNNIVAIIVIIIIIIILCQM